MLKRCHGFTLIELLASIVVIGILLSAIAWLTGRASGESQALGWVEGVRTVVQSARDGYKTRDDYSGLTYSVALANGWVPRALQSPSPLTMGQTPWSGTGWSIGPYVGAPVGAPVFLTVGFGPNQVASCIAVTNALMDSTSVIGRLEGWYWFVPSQGTGTMVTGLCANKAGPYTIMFGFPY